MKFSIILDNIDSCHMALPEFQRGYVWNGEQGRGLFDSLYRRHPVDGILAFDFSDPDTGEQKAVFDLAWPAGLQEKLSAPVAVLLNESAEVIALASRAGYQRFTSVEDFKRYVAKDILSFEVSQ